MSLRPVRKLTQHASNPLVAKEFWQLRNFAHCTRVYEAGCINSKGSRDGRLFGHEMQHAAIQVQETRQLAKQGARWHFIDNNARLCADVAVYKLWLTLLALGRNHETISGPVGVEKGLLRQSPVAMENLNLVTWAMQVLLRCTKLSCCQLSLGWKETIVSIQSHLNWQPLEHVLGEPGVLALIQQ